PGRGNQARSPDSLLCQKRGGLRRVLRSGGIAEGCGRKRSVGRQAVRDKGGAASEGSRNRRVEAGSPPDDPGESPAQVSGCGAVPIRLSNQIEGTRSVRPGQKDGENRRQFHGGSQQAEIP